MLKSLNFLHVFTGKKHVTAQRACRTILANTHILSQNYELFFFKYQSILNFSSLFCASVITIVLWPFQLHWGAHGASVPDSNCLLVIKLEATTGHSIEISLLHNISRSQQAPNTSSGYENLCIVIDYCALLCIIVHYCVIIVHVKNRSKDQK